MRRGRITSMVRPRRLVHFAPKAVGRANPDFLLQSYEPVLKQDVINHVADIFEEKGSNAWFELEASALMPPGYRNAAAAVVNL